MPFLNIFSKRKTKEKLKTRIIIDHRERNSKIPSLLNKDFLIEFRQLPVADYIIKETAIERKTLSDLKSSIINKRIISQLKELKQYPKHLLIIENNDLSCPAICRTPNLHENALRGFLLSVALDLQIPIIFTKNAEETAEYIHVLARKTQNPEPSIRASKIFKSKKQQLQYILEGFPLIGPIKAKKLLKKFGSIKNIINAPEFELKSILGKRTNNFRSLIE